ncbi:hypothetical protein SETIT_6G143500v2 [Setaria italica]|uniref:Rab-GAP TBC domain-containing protein n=1 Tax=Setaria italica TaxID=4555 RepID=A0A368RLE9_SETIT|nr:hypothetical protein SETIT_6G143500v2 [Setaria italica]
MEEDGSRDRSLMNPGVYEALVIYETLASELEIIRDISRTFPSHIFFQQRHGPGQRSLYNILKAYSVYGRDVGYVQGMGFLAGLLLLYINEDAFTCQWKACWFATFAQYLSQFEKLVMEHMPKLGQHFVEEMITPSMYARQWFITVFAYSFLFHLTLRVWDVFLYEGIKVVFQFVLALLRFCHDGLVSSFFFCRFCLKAHFKYILRNIQLLSYCWVKLPFEKLLQALRNSPRSRLIQMFYCQFPLHLRSSGVLQSS